VQQLPRSFSAWANDGLAKASEPSTGAKRAAFFEAAGRPTSGRRRDFEAQLARLEHARVRDLAWAALNPALCSGRDPQHGSVVLTDARMRDLLGEGTWAKLAALDADPAPLERWLRSHKHAQNKFVGFYYENLMHFAFCQLGGVEVALYSESVPKEKSRPKLPPAVTAFKPELRSSRGRAMFCKVHRAVRENTTLKLEFNVYRGNTTDALPSAADAILYVAGEARRPMQSAPSNVVDDDGAVGYVLFPDVPIDVPLRFQYAPRFSIIDVAKVQAQKQECEGEVDYVLWRSQAAPRFLHVEVAVKFYLASKELMRTWDDFIAPNPSDILGQKLRRMLTHQLPMGQKLHIRRALAERMVNVSSEKGRCGSDLPSLGTDCDAVDAALGDIQVEDSLWMNGRLFFHTASPLTDPRAPVESWHDHIPMLSEDMELGWWCRFKELSQVLPIQGCVYLVLQKPYWLAPLRCSGSLHQDHGPCLSREELLAAAVKWRKFQYISVLVPSGSGDDEGGTLSELCRGFVVPDDWPKLKGGGWSKRRPVSKDAEDRSRSSRP